MNDLSPLLISLAAQLHNIATEYVDMKFTPSEEAMTWPIAIIVEDDGEIGVWCAKDDCVLDGHNARIDGFPRDNFTMANLADCLVSHIERIKERDGDGE